MNIFIGNIPFRATDEELRAEFEQYGEVSSAKILSDRETGRSRGYGFVEMPNAAEAQSAIEGLNQFEFMGRALNVNEARPNHERGRRG